jgi:hypothetical protein
MSGKRSTLESTAIDSLVESPHPAALTQEQATGLSPDRLRRFA